MTKQIYVGNLPDDIIERTLDERFSKYGRIAAMHVKYPSRMPPFAYITYEKPRDAEDATRDMNGRPLNGSRVRVEVVDPREDGRHFRGTQFRVLLSDLPVSVEWQELKDHCRTAADVVTVEVDRRGNGVASFATHDEMERAIRALDQSDFRGERIRAKEDPNHGSGHLRMRVSHIESVSRRPSTTGYRGWSRSRSHSRSRSPLRRRHRSRSRSRSR